MCEDVPRCENIKKDVRKLSDIWFPEHFKVYNAYWNRPKTVKHLALSPNGKDNNSTLDKSKTKKSFVVSFRSPEVAGTATSRDRLLQQGSGADRAHVLRRPQVIRLITRFKRTSLCGVRFYLPSQSFASQMPALPGGEPRNIRRKCSPLPLGEVAEQSEVGEGTAQVPQCKTAAPHGTNRYPTNPNRSSCDNNSNNCNFIASYFVDSKF